jgi:hypothetical protein
MFRPSFSLACALAALVGGCSAAPPKQVSDSDDFASSEAPPKTSSPEPDEPSGEPPSSSSSSDGPSSPPAPSDAGSQDHDITNRDCAALGEQFGRAIKNDEMAKLDPRLKPNQRDAAVSSIDAAAKVRAEQWSESCQKSLVGMIRQRKELDCAMAAKSVKAFDDCLNAQPGAQ